MEGDFELRHILFYGGCGFTIMRCMSFALENCDRKDGNYNILELLKYNFYLPFFYFGPIMTFDKFYVQVSQIRFLFTVNPAAQGLLHFVNALYGVVFIEQWFPTFFWFVTP